MFSWLFGSKKKRKTEALELTAVSSKPKLTKTNNNSKSIQFVNEMNPLYNCGICHNIPCKPLSCGNSTGCIAVFCTVCLTSWLAISDKCPECRVIIACNKPATNDKVNSIIYNELVYCPYSVLNDGDLSAVKKLKISAETTVLIPRSGCRWVGPLNELKAHMSKDCELALLASATDEGLISLDLLDDADGLEPTTPTISEAQQPSACDKVTVTCTACELSYSVNDLDAHDGVCPEKPIICSFACHGCNVVVPRKSADQHKIDHSIIHSELLASRLFTLDKLVTSIHHTLAHHLASTVKEDTVTLTWRIERVAEHMALQAPVCSKPFKINDGNGDSLLYFKCEFTATDELSFYLHKDLDGSLNKGPVAIGGSEVTLLHPTDASKNKVMVYSNGHPLKAPFFYRGWRELTHDIKPYISTTVAGTAGTAGSAETATGDGGSSGGNCSISFSCKIKYQVNHNSDDIIVL